MKVLPQEKIGPYLSEAEKRGLLAAYYLELTTGLRRGELLALLWTDLDIEARTISVTQTGIGAGSRQRNQRSGQQIILSQKGRKGQDSSFFPPSTHLHTQEVTGSSPVVSTTWNTREIPRATRLWGFFIVSYFNAKWRSQMLLNAVLWG